MDKEPDFVRSMGREVWIEDNPSKVESAITRGFDPNYYDNDGATTIHRVAEAGCVQALKIFLSYDITRIDVKDHLGQSPLHYAARCNDFDNAVETTRLLLAAGIDIDLECNDVNHPTALFIALNTKNAKLVEFLLERGADVNKVNFSDVTLLLKLVTTNFSDEELELFIPLLLYYNVDVNCPFNTHPLLIGICYSKKRLIEMLANYLTDFDFICISKTSFDFNSVLKLVIQCFININLEWDTCLYILDRIDFNECDANEICEALILTRKYQDVNLFNYLYSKIDKDAISLSNSSIQLSEFFEDNVLSKSDFIHACELLFKHEFTVLWQAASLDQCLVTFMENAYQLFKLSYNEMENIIYQMLPYSNNIDARELLVIFVNFGFTREFEIYLRHDPLINLTNNFVALFGANLNDSFFSYFKGICFPSYQPNAPITVGVLSLKCLSRNVIRSNLYPQFPVKLGTYNLFRYYNRVQKLPVPRIIIDIITLKVLI